MATPANMNPTGQSSEAAIFEAALVCVSPEQRAAYLDQACEGQPELRRRVEELLASDSEASGFLEKAPAPSPTSPVGVPSRERDGPAPEPSRVGRDGTPGSTVALDL